MPYWETGVRPYAEGYFGGEGAGAKHQALAAFDSGPRESDGRTAFGGGKFGTGPEGAFGVKGDADSSASGSNTAGA